MPSNGTVQYDIRFIESDIDENTVIKTRTLNVH